MSPQMIIDQPILIVPKIIFKKKIEMSVGAVKVHAMVIHIQELKKLGEKQNVFGMGTMMLNVLVNGIVNVKMVNSIKIVAIFVIVVSLFQKKKCVKKRKGLLKNIGNTILL